MATQDEARIVKTPEVLHGKPRLAGTRIGVFQVGELVRRNGWSPADVTAEFELHAGQVRAALEYYDDHPELVETLRAQHRAGVRSLRKTGRAE